MSDPSNAEIMRVLGRIEGRLESMDDIPKRVRTLEQRQSWYAGAAVVVASVVSFIASKLNINSLLN